MIHKQKKLVNEMKDLSNNMSLLHSKLTTIEEDIKNVKLSLVLSGVCISLLLSAIVMLVLI